MYTVIFIDAIHVKIRDGQVANRPVYTAIGVNVDGERDILGLWVGTGAEGAKYWQAVLTEIKNRGVGDVYLVVCDGLKSPPEWIEATRRRRPRHLRRSGPRGPPRRTAHQPQPTVRAGPRPDGADRGRDPGDRGRGLARGRLSPRVTTTSATALTLDLAGTFAFTLDGALIAVRAARLDIVGVVTLGMITALGGGILRDVLLGDLPPATFSEWRYLVVAASAGSSRSP
jgi:mutator family transposase/glycine transporter